jgi:stearoyl-CoA desaturase (delta-9 desaturase)
MPAHASARDWATVLSFGFNIDRYGERRRPVVVNMIALGVLLPVGSIWAIYRMVTSDTGLGVWWLAIGLYVFAMFGVTLGNHRYWTHRGFKVRKPVQIVLAVASALSLEGDIEQWVLTHRAHHRNPDVVGLDPHSPYEYAGWHGLKGLAWAQIVWVLFQRPEGMELSPQRDLTEDPVVQAQRKWFPYVAVGQFPALLALYPIFGLNALLIAGTLRCTVLLTSTGMVNSVCHRWGTRAKDSLGREFRRDDSRNNVVVALLAGGEGNHAWHHVDPVCARHGRKVALDACALEAGTRASREWCPDITWRMIQLLVLVNLVYDVRRPRTTMYFAPSQLVESPELAFVQAAGGAVPLEPALLRQVAADPAASQLEVVPPR